MYAIIRFVRCTKLLVAKIRNRSGNVPRGFVVVRVTNSIVTLIYEY